MQQQEFVRLKSMYINRDFHKIKEEFMKTLGDMNDMQVQHYQFKDLVTQLMKENGGLKYRPQYISKALDNPKRKYNVVAVAQERTKQVGKRQIDKIKTGQETAYMVELNRKIAIKEEVENQRRIAAKNKNFNY